MRNNSLGNARTDIDIGAVPLCGRDAWLGGMFLETTNLSCPNVSLLGPEPTIAAPLSVTLTAN